MDGMVWGRSADGTCVSKYQLENGPVEDPKCVNVRKCAGPGAYVRKCAGKKICF